MDKDIRGIFRSLFTLLARLFSCGLWLRKIYFLFLYRVQKSLCCITYTWEKISLICIWSNNVQHKVIKLLVSCKAICSGCLVKLCLTKYKHAFMHKLYHYGVPKAECFFISRKKSFSDSTCRKMNTQSFSFIPT